MEVKVNPVKAFRLLEVWHQVQALNSAKGSFMIKFAQYVHLALTASAVVGVPTMASKWLAQPSHAAVFSVLVGISVVLHAIAPSIFGAPSDAAVSSSKLGVWMLISLLVISPFQTGCTQQQKVNVAQEIVNWTPTIESAVNTIAATASVLDPAAAPVFAIATSGLDVLSSGLTAAAKTYLANPSQTNLQLLQAVVVQLQQKVNTGILQVAGIKDANSQKTALAAINGLATGINAVLGLVQSVSTKAQVAAMAQQVTVTYAMVRPLLDRRAMRAVGARYGTTPDQFFAFEAQAGF